MATNAKKRKRNVVLHQGSTAGEADTSKPTAVFQPKKGRVHTLSIALPGSIISNAQTYELKLSLAGTIARACAVFSVDEVIIFDDGQNKIKGPRNLNQSIRPDDEPWQDPNQFLYHILSYVETPPHLRRYLFPMHPSLRGAGALPSLDMPHHLKADEWCQYREGVVVSQDTTSNSQAKKARLVTKKSKGNNAAGSTVDCGFPFTIGLDDSIPSNTRVTVKFASAAPPDQFPGLPELQNNPAALNAEATSAAAPREEAGYYWGYTTRRCDSLSSVFTECPFQGGYDISIGTSERGVPLSDLLSTSGSANGKTPSLPTQHNHLLLTFGGVAGIEAAITADKEFAARGVTAARAGEVFDQWVNLVPGQGSRTIRTEEAVWLGLMGLREFIERQE